MKKQTMALVLAVAVVLFVVAALSIYGCVSNEKPKPEQVFSCLPSEISRYVVQDGADGYTLVKDGDVWTLENNHIAVLKQDEVTKIVNGASMLTAQKRLSEKELDGFEKTRTQRVEIHLADNRGYAFEFMGVKGSSCAMRDVSSGILYQVSLSVRDTLVVPIDRFRELLVYENLTETEDALTAFKYTDYEGNKTVIRLKTAAEISKKPSNRYVMESPYKRDVDDHLFEQQIAVKIPSITITKYVDDFPEDISVYGLDKESRAELNFTWADTKYTLYLGTNENGLVYATKADSDSIFLINSTQLEFLDVDPFYVLETDILETDITHIRSITARKAGTTYRLRCTAPGADGALYYVNNKAASKYVFDTAVSTLGEIKILNALLTVPEQKDAMEIEIAYDNRQSVQRLKFVPLNDKEYALFINQAAEFAVDKSAVDSLFAELETISKNPMQTGEKG